VQVNGRSVGQTTAERYDGRVSRVGQARDTTARAIAARTVDRALFSTRRAPLEEGIAYAEQVSAFMLEQIEEALNSGAAAGIFDIKMTFADEAIAVAFGDMPSDQVYDWLKQNNREAEVYELTYKAVCHALGRDLLEFAGVAIKAAKSGIWTPAFALLRKPFKENLFYLEWILADPEDFYQRFSSGDPAALKVTPIPAQRKLQIIGGAIDASGYPNWISAQQMYDLRFNKQSKLGLETFWQKANHLITSDGAALRTEAENFNFVFSNNDSRASQRHWFYGTVPILLFHSLQVMEAMIAMFARRAEPDIIPLRTLAGLFLWMRSAAYFIDLRPTPVRFGRIIGKRIHAVRCDKCRSTCRLSIDSLAHLFNHGSLQCDACGCSVEPQARWPSSA